MENNSQAIKKADKTGFKQDRIPQFDILHSSFQYHSGMLNPDRPGQTDDLELSSLRSQLE